MHVIEYLKVLELAEEKFGSRDKTYDFKGLGFFKGGPLLEPNFDEKTFRIWLSPGAENYQDTRLYELAHEVIHVLTPCSRDDVTVFEEGLAVWNSRSFYEKDHKYRSFMGAKAADLPPDYKRAHELFCEFVAIAPDGVKDLRTKWPKAKISQFTQQDLLDVAPGLDFDVAAELASKFNPSPEKEAL